MAVTDSRQLGLPLEATLPPAPLLLVRHPRARRYVIRVLDDGTVRVTIPRWGSKRAAHAFADSERHWIERQRQRVERLARATFEGREAQARREAWEGEQRQRASRELPARLLELAARHGFAAGAIRKISVRNQKWRWGSCSPNGHISLNWRLVTMAANVRDYVLIHELMHLKRMDHSKKFWKLVAQACPDYRELRRQLRSFTPHVPLPPSSLPLP